MKNNQEKKNIRLGAFVSVGIALFIIAIYFIGAKQQLFTRTIRLSGLFTDIEGLQIGNNVRFSGINVGTIDDIVIVSDSFVKVDVVIKRKVQRFIKKDAIASIGSEGLMGNKVLNISPGSGHVKTMIRDGDLIRTKQLASMDDILVKMDSVAGNVVFITGDLKDVLGNMRAGKGTLGKLFMDDKIGESVEATMINMEKSTATLDKDLKALQSNWFFKKGIKKQEEAAQAKADSIAAAKAGKTLKQYYQDEAKKK
jgi:phospholipid/cholesterol/gamma-HCH transport system substrate-binding protein